MTRTTTEPSRPRRPALVELAAAILVVGGAISVLTSIQLVFKLAEEGQALGGLGAVTIGIGAALIVLGVAVRSGRAWLLTLNVVAVLAFLELTSGSVVGLLFGGLDVFVVLALFRERPWFQWRPRSALDAPDGETADEIALEEEEHQRDG